jgi:hypothetical protein
MGKAWKPSESNAFSEMGEIEQFFFLRGVRAEAEERFEHQESNMIHSRLYILPLTISMITATKLVPDTQKSLIFSVKLVWKVLTNLISRHSIANPPEAEVCGHFLPSY